MHERVNYNKEKLNFVVKEHTVLLVANFVAKSKWKKYTLY